MNCGLDLALAIIVSQNILLHLLVLVHNEVLHFTSKSLELIYEARIFGATHVTLLIIFIIWLVCRLRSNQGLPFLKHHAGYFMTSGPCREARIDNWWFLSQLRAALQRQGVLMCAAFHWRECNLAARVALEDKRRLVHVACHFWGTLVELFRPCQVIYTSERRGLWFGPSVRKV